MIDPVLGAEFLQRLPDAALIVRADGTICFANQTAQSLARWKTPIVGQPIAAIVPDWKKDFSFKSSDKRLETEIQCGDGNRIAVGLQTIGWVQDGSPFLGVVLRTVASEDGATEGSADKKSRAKIALEMAQTAQKRLEQIVEMLPQAVCVFDAQDRYVLWNRRYAELYPEIAPYLRVGIPFAEILRLSLDGGNHPERVEDKERWLADRLAKHALPCSQEEQEWRDGRWVLHDDRRLSDGGAIGMRIDITDLKRREASFRLLFQSNPVPMLLFEPETLRIVDVNDSAIAVYGFGRETFLTRSLTELHDPLERKLAAETFGGLAAAYDGRTVWRHRTAKDESFDALIFVRASESNQRPCFLAAIVDVSDRIRAEAQIAHIANHDPLTGLANRIRFRQVAEATLQCKPSRSTRHMAVHCIDLDGFKPVNDTFGHLAGDSLLRLVAERLQSVARRGDLVARLGGDEFVVLQTSGLSAVGKIAQRLLSVFDAPFRVGDADVQIGASLGFAIAPEDGATIDELLAAADAALYVAKAEGRSTWRAAGEVARRSAAPRRLRPYGERRKAS
jgi:diguanylate cyclase (GGDEF)-like protein/PAS domain S-box-containing protein